MTETTAPPVDSTVDSDGVPIAARDYGGDGVPILLIHGAGLTLESFGLMVPFLTSGHRVVSMDIRNHGHSGDGPFEWPAVLADVRAVIDHFRLEAPTIVGHSLGGMIAALLGGTDTGLRVAVNLDGHGLGTPDLYDGMSAAAVAEGRELWDKAMAPLRVNETTISFEQLSAAVSAGAPDEATAASALRSHLRGLVEGPEGMLRPRSSAAAQAEMMEAVESLVPDLFKAYRECRCPLLVVNAKGADPQVLALATAYGVPQAIEMFASYRRGLSRALGDLAAEHAHIGTVDIEAGHGLITDQPERVAQLCLDFIDTSG